MGIKFCLLSVALFVSFWTHGNCQGDYYCEGEWRGYSSSCYLLVLTGVDMAAASSGCEARGATLASISNADENNFLKEYMSDESVVLAWIGLTKDADNCGSADLECRRRNWKWTDGTPYDYDTWHGWYINDPEASELCARLSQRGWFGRPCYFTYSYICEKAALTTTTTTTSTTTTTTTTTAPPAITTIPTTASVSTTTAPSTSVVSSSQPVPEGDQSNSVSVSLISACVFGVLFLLATVAAVVFYTKWMILRNNKLATKEAAEKMELDETVTGPGESGYENVNPVASPQQVLPEVNYETPGPSPQPAPSIYERIKDTVYENP